MHVFVRKGKTTHFSLQAESFGIWQGGQVFLMGAGLFGPAPGRKMPPNVAKNKNSRMLLPKQGFLAHLGRAGVTKAPG